MKKNTKSILAIIFAVIMIGIFTACTAGVSEETANGTIETNDTISVVSDEESTSELTTVETTTEPTAEDTPEPASDQTAVIAKPSKKSTTTTTKAKTDNIKPVTTTKKSTSKQTTTKKAVTTTKKAVTTTKKPVTTTKKAVTTTKKAVTTTKKAVTTTKKAVTTTKKAVTTTKKAVTTTKKPVTTTKKNVTPQEVQQQVNAYIKSKVIRVDSSMTPNNSGWSTQISRTQESLNEGYTLKMCKAFVDHEIKEFNGQFFGMYCYYDSNAFYILYL